MAVDAMRALIEGLELVGIVWLIWKQIRPGTPEPGSLTWIHRDLTGMRDTIRKDASEMKTAAHMLERRVLSLEDSDGMHRRAILEFGEHLRGMRAEVTAIHSEVRVLNANSGTTLRAMETMLAVKQSLERIEQRLPGPA